MKKNNIKILSEKTHALKRAGRYLGQITPAEINRYSIIPSDDGDKIWFGTVKYVPALLKIFREFLDNSIDEAIRTNYKFANKINIIIEEDCLVISDNGRGIPIIPAQDEFGEDIDIMMPEAAWVNLRAGSNFDDEADNTSIGQNGEGASLGVFFASKFIGETRDSKKIFTIVTTNNVGTKVIDIQEKKLKDKDRGTQIIFYPDKEKLNIEEDIDLTQVYLPLIKYELIFLSLTYPEITFVVNGEPLKIKQFKDLKNYFNYSDELLGNKPLEEVSEDSVTYSIRQDFDMMVFETDNVTIALGNSLGNGYSNIHFVNGINTYNGGDVLEWGEKRILLPLVEKIQKKYKNIKAADIKNHLMFTMIVKNIPNPRFGDQIKSLCINTASQFPEISKELLDKVNIDKFINKVYKNKIIMEPVIDIYRANQIMLENKKVKGAQKTKRAPAKYWPATKLKKRLFLSEGDSAINPLISELGRDENGFFPLKGKMINCLKKSLSLVIKNDEVLELAEILGIDLTNDQNGLTQPLKYSEIIIASDSDVDGSHIALLVLAFFAKFAPAYLEKLHIYRFLTPVLIALKNDKPAKMFFKMEEFLEYDKTKPSGISYFYAKGLGSLSETHWETLFKKYTLDELCQPLTFENSSDKALELLEFDSWLGSDTDFRKEKILELLRDFDLDKA